MITQLDYKTQETFYDIVSYFSFFVIFASGLGLSAFAPEYINDLNYFLMLYVAIILIWRFHPFRATPKFTNLDRKIAFTAGCFILTTNFLNKYSHHLDLMGYLNSINSLDALDSLDFLVEAAEVL